jgi:L-rhamnose-H+ transport protein
MWVGLLLVLFAALLQGTFLMPLALTRKWAWEHGWAAFSLFAMIVLNWAIASVVLPNPIAIYALVPWRDLFALAAFGAGWGVGAVLFGLGMDKLGLTLGYPLIMGLNAAVGALVPLFWLRQADPFSTRTLILAGGIALAIAGIIVCSIAGAYRNPAPNSQTAPPSAFRTGLLIAVVAGCLSALPNVGMAWGASVIEKARLMGATATLAGNAVWAIFFTVGGLVNLAYCGWLMVHRSSLAALAGPESPRNLGLSSVSSLMWIGSLYLYGSGAARMGQWGAPIGWPVMTATSIGVGISWGLLKGDWRGAPRAANRLLVGGLLLIVAAVAWLGFANRV